MSVAEIAKRLCVPLDTVYRDLNHKHEQVLSAVSEYGHFRRIENERQLESIKALMAGYMFNDKVVIQEQIIDKESELKTVTLSNFDAMMKATTIFLGVVNLQNKMWNLYSAPEPKSHDATTLNVKNVNVVAMVKELEQIAKKENLLPLRRTKATAVENG